LVEQKKSRPKIAAGQKSKALSEEVSELKVKRNRLQTDAETLSTAADDFSVQAEKLQKLPLLAKANSMRRAARKKTEQLKGLNQLIDNKQSELANCPP